MDKKNMIFKKTLVSLVSLATVSTSVMPIYTVYAAERENMALNKDTIISSSEVEAFSGDKAVDGDRTSKTSRWSSMSNDNEFITVDLGERKTFDEVVLYWEGAYASEYKIQVSDDNQVFRDVATVKGKEGEVSTIFDAVTARYVRMQGVRRATGYGYSIYEFEVYNNVQIDKAPLEEAIQAFGGLDVGENPTRYAQKEYKKSLAKANEILAKEDATQQEIEYARLSLEKTYWFVLVEDKNCKYSVKNGEVDYSKYTTESIIPIVGTYIKCQNVNGNTSTDKLKEMYDMYLEAEKVALVEAGETPERVTVGVNQDATTNADKKTGLFTMDEKIVDVDGKKKIQLTVTFRNTGIHPFTQVQKDQYKSSELSKDENRYATLYYTLYEPVDGTTGGSKSLKNIQPLDGSYSNGFVSEMLVEPGIYTVDLEIGSNEKTAMPGYYYTSRCVEEAESADKTVLGQKLNEYRTFETETNYLIKELQKAVTAGDEVFNNTKATQEEVNAAVTELDRCYWMVKAGDLYKQQDTLSKRNDKVDPHIGYVGYLSESTIPVMKLRMEIGISFNTKKDQAYYEDIYNRYVEAISKLEKAPEALEEVMVGLARYVHENSAKEAGNFIIDEEWITDQDGQPKIRLTVTYENTGIHPITGKEKTKFTAEDLEEGILTLRYQKGTRNDFKRTPLNGSYDNGFIATIDVDPGWYIVEVNANGKVGTMGKYYTSTTPKPKVDKDELSEFYNKVKDYTCDGDFYDEFTEALEKANTVLEDKKATQEAVDTALDELQQRYWLCEVNTYVGKYRPDEKKKPGFKYDEYELSSIMDVLKVQLEARNHTNISYPADKLKDLYDRFVEAEKKIVKVPENPREVFVGPETDTINTGYTGHFTMTVKEVDNQIVLHIEYFNDGINPYTGKAQEEFSFSDTNKWSVYLDYETYKGASGSKPITSNIQPLDGKTSLTDGFQVDVLVDPGRYSVEVTSGRKTGKMIGSYYTKEISSVPPVIEGIKDGVYTNKDVTLSIHDVDGDIDRVLVNGEEVALDALTFTEEGFYTVVAIDEAGNETTITFTIDKTAPNASIAPVNDGSGRVRLKFNEVVTIDDPDWAISDIPTDKDDVGKIWLGTLTENRFYEVTASDLAGNEVVKVIDHERPAEVVEYSTTEPTKDEVTVTIRFTNEESVRLTNSSQNPGWKETAWASGIYTKTFKNNAKESVRFHDNMGNETTVTVSVQNIDKVAPEVVKVVPNEDGTVTVKFNEVVAEVEGGDWVLSDKKYEDDGKYWIGTLTEDKIYDVTAYDLAGNSVTFQVDHETPKAKVEYSTTEPTNGEVTVTVHFANEKYVVLTSSTANLGWTKVDDTTYTKTYSENATESVKFHDGMGNITTVSVNVSNIDHTVPVINGIENGVITNKDVTLTVIEDNLDTIMVNGKEATVDELTFTKDGVYTVVVTDKAGHSTDITFTIDKTAPVIDGIKDGEETDKEVTIKVSDDNLDNITVNGDKVSVTALIFKEPGNYVIVATDKAGNETTVTFTIKKKETPIEPIEPGKPGDGEDNNTPDTGDTTNANALFTMLLLAGAILAYSKKKEME